MTKADKIKRDRKLLAGHRILEDFHELDWYVPLDLPTDVDRLAHFYAAVYAKMPKVLIPHCMTYAKVFGVMRKAGSVEAKSVGAKLRYVKEKLIDNYHLYYYHYAQAACATGSAETIKIGAIKDAETWRRAGIRYTRTRSTVDLSEVPGTDENKLYIERFKKSGKYVHLLANKDLQAELKKLNYIAPVKN